MYKCLKFIHMQALTHPTHNLCTLSPNPIKPTHMLIPAKVCTSCVTYEHIKQKLNNTEHKLCTYKRICLNTQTIVSLPKE